MFALNWISVAFHFKPKIVAGHQAKQKCYCKKGKLTFYLSSFVRLFFES